MVVTKSGGNFVMSLRLLFQRALAHPFKRLHRIKCEFSHRSTLKNVNGKSSSPRDHSIQATTAVSSASNNVTSSESGTNLPTIDGATNAAGDLNNGEGEGNDGDLVPLPGIYVPGMAFEDYNVPFPYSQIRYEELKILIVDDSVATLRICSLMFSRRGSETQTAQNGQEALNILFPNSVVNRSQQQARAAASNSFDVVLMDVNMPVMGGVQAIQRIRANTLSSSSSSSVVPSIDSVTAHYHDTSRDDDSASIAGTSAPTVVSYTNPAATTTAAALQPRKPVIIAISLGMDTATRAACLRAGANAVLPKPFTFDQFEEVMRPLHNQLR